VNSNKLYNSKHLEVTLSKLAELETLSRAELLLKRDAIKS
jgi:hypothetical protein